MAQRVTLIPAYQDEPRLNFVDSVALPYASGSAAMTGGWIADDSNPASGSMVFGSGSFFDADYGTVVHPEVSTDYSIGVDLTGLYSVAQVRLYYSGSAAGLYSSGSNASLQLFTSSQNNYYGLWPPINGLDVYPYSGSIHYINYEPPEPFVCQYFKFNAFAGPIKDVLGANVGFTQIEVYLAQTNALISGSLWPERKQAKTTIGGIKATVNLGPISNQQAR